ncbi:MAG: DNA polymerase/3'-5' exonuclease PolX [Verrucomicrobiales bacterium]
MTRDQIGEVLERIALLLEVKGENPFKIRAYRQGADAVLNFAGDIVAKAAANEMEGIQGLGAALRGKLHELATTGRLQFFEDLKVEFPETIFELFRVPGVGAKRIAVLHSELGVGSLADLKKACESGTVAALAGFGEKMVGKILEALAYLETAATSFRAAEVAGSVGEILGFLRTHKKVSRAEVAGSYRRGREIVNDLDFVVATKHAELVLNDFVKQTFVLNVLAHGPTKASVRLTTGVQCDIRAVNGSEFPCALIYFTGSKEHNVALRTRALKRGWTLNEYRLEGCQESLHEETDVYKALGLEFIDPELREDQGEIELAEMGSLPKLIELQNLRGTFHCHTRASDGHGSIESMAEAARELGLQYLGIADHSQSSIQANGLTAARLTEQVREIAAWNALNATPKFRLFSGIEVDILRDGSLDFPDEVLAGLDYVVASVHSIFTLPEAEMTRRVTRAVENRHVTMLGHLTGRLLLKREGYALNIPAVIEACASTGTIIELNCHPARLDMDWRWWRLAREKGVKCVINPDAHSEAGLQHLFFGIRSARKGWLTRNDVVNCLPLGKIEHALQAKRHL